MGKSMLVLLGCLLATFKCFGSYILWFDINAPESKVGSIPFIEYFENHTIAGKAETDGIDLVALGDNGEFLYNALIDEPFIVWLEKDGAGGYSYSAISSQVDASNTDSIKLMAGYFDWDSLGDDEITLDLFTPFAYLESTISDILYATGQLEPSNKWNPTQWNPIGDIPIPEPSISIFLLIGTLILLPLREL